MLSVGISSFPSRSYHYFGLKRVKGSLSFLFIAAAPPPVTTVLAAVSNLVDKNLKTGLKVSEPDVFYRY